MVTARMVCGSRLLISLAFAFALIAIQAGGSAAPERKPTETAPTSLAALGERLYKTGIGTSGKPVAAIDISGQRVFAPQFHCMACHRTSGYGSKEGGVYIPPISAKILYQPMVPNRARAFNGMYLQDANPEMVSRIKSGRTRPAYNLASLGMLLRLGIDSAGEEIPHAMPRFEVSQNDVAALDAFLRTLSAHSDPGVDETKIRFAVIVSDRTPQLSRKALLETSRVYFERINRGISGDRSRPNFSPLFRSEFAAFWREWELEIWTLHGDTATWPQQLREYYDKLPVFAVIGGAVSAPWQPIGDFCDQEKLPCLFPLTDLPSATANTAGYTLYSYGGLPLEASAMAQYLAREQGLKKIVQLAAIGPSASVPANTFVQEFAKLQTGSAVQTLSVDAAAWDRAVADATRDVGTDGVLIIWPGPDAQAAVTALARTGGQVRRILLASQAEPFAIKALSGTAFADRVRLMRPTELPNITNPHSYRVRAWLNARQVVVDPPEEQFQVYYALSVLEKAVMEIQGDYSREYLIEQIEMIAESNLSPGVYPNLTLGPSQRIASRGSYVVKLDPSEIGGISADGDWIVP